MGFAPVAATSILLIAGLLSLNAYHSESDVSQDMIREARADADRRETEKRQTEIELVSSTYEIGLDRLTLDVLNTGDTVIDTSEIEVLVDGVVRSDDIVWIRFDGGDVAYWHPLQQVEIRLDNISSTPSQVKIVSHNGVAEVGAV